MQSLLRQYTPRIFIDLANGYGWIALLPSWQAGLILSLMTMVEPQSGAIGLASGMCAWLASELAGAHECERPVSVFNGLLSGLFVAHVWAPGQEILALALLCGVLAGWLTVVLGRLSWSLGQLPILSLPFSIVAMLSAAAGGSLSALQYLPYVAPTERFGSHLDPLFSAFGHLYFQADPLAGLCVLIVMLLLSRYYVLIALLGYGASWLWLRTMGAAPEHLTGSAWDSNAVLASILVGGLFARPSWVTATLATLAGITAAWLSLALARILNAAHLVPFSAPFVLATWLVLYAAVRNTRITSYFHPNAPELPERSHERAQISLGRVGNPASVPLSPPFAGTWTVSQGVDGPHTHRGNWRYALDFIATHEGRSFANQGNRLEDFYGYNQPVLSPAYGQVWRIVNDVPDNTPGSVNVAANWGNCVLIRLHDGKLALLAHLKPGSIAVVPGQWIKPGDLLGYCGNSGRSPQPHIHLHVQTADDPSAPTVPFHLCSVLVSDDDPAPRYELSITPKESATLTAAFEGSIRPFYLLAGRGLRYSVTHNEKLSANWSVHCEVDPLGRLNLVSSLGARCLIESTWAVFSCYERSGPADPHFDLWMLACGYTPVSFHVAHWRERFTPARLIPNRWAQLLSALMWPCASFATARYERHWDEDAQGWLQTARHRQRLSGIDVHTQALIRPEIGCTSVAARVGQDTYALQATSTFQRADIGVPAWEVAMAVAPTLTRLL